MKWSANLRFGVLAGCGLAALCPLAAAIQITQYSRQPGGFAITWTAEPGKTYKLLAAPSITGPWSEQTNLTAVTDRLSWTMPETVSQAQRFYRVYLPPQAGFGAELLAGASVPPSVGATALETANLGAQAVFLASLLGTGGAQLVTTGTLTQQGSNWNYSGNPNDRLSIQFQTGSNLTYYVTRMEGNFNQDATVFLENPHQFDYRVVVPGMGDLTFQNSIPAGTCNFEVTARGSLNWSNATYAIDLALNGVYCVDTSFGYQLLNDYTTTGTVTAPGYALVVNQRWRHELIGGQGGNASSVEEWNNSTLTLGSDIFEWNDTKKQKSFRDGKPSSLDTYWQASGSILRNGSPYGAYRLEPLPLLGIVKFVLDLPGETIDLEVWNVIR